MRNIPTQKTTSIVLFSTASGPDLPEEVRRLVAGLYRRKEHVAIIFQ
jgi:hypothetical protein